MPAWPSAPPSILVAMALDPDRFDAVICDYGNTLVAFGGAQVQVEFTALHGWLQDRHGPCELAALKALRDRQMVTPYEDHWRENDLQAVCAELVSGLYPGRQASAEEVAAIVALRHRHFVEQTPAPAGVAEALEHLSRRFRVGVLSNYPNGKSVRESLAGNGLGAHVDAVVVSGDPDLQVVKPHPQPFHAMCAELSVEPERCVVVGDNWLADIQGAKRLGMAAIHSIEHQRYDGFDPEPGDHPADAVVERFTEVVDLLQ